MLSIEAEHQNWESKSKVDVSFSAIAPPFAECHLFPTTLKFPIWIFEPKRKAIEKRKAEDKIDYESASLQNALSSKEISIN